MEHHRIRRCTALLAACTILFAAVPMTGITADAANLISNSTFDSGTSGWSSYRQSGGNCTLSTDSGRLALTITDVGTLNYSVQFGYDVVPLYQNGVYHLQYDISSTVDRTVEGMIQQNGGTYQAYTWKSLSLTAEPQTVDYTFTMTAETDIMAKLVFNCGTQGTELPEHTIYLDNVSLELVDDSEVNYTELRAYEPPIVIDQVGYLPESEKIAVFRTVTDETEFSVHNAATDEVVYTGALYGERNNSSADEIDFYGDFSDVTEPGDYYITCGDLDDSYTFTIGDDVYDTLMDETVKMLYLQRCGCEVVDDTFGHVACHNTPAVIYGTTQTIDVSGGWHDAGDYGRYVVPGAKAVADLLYAYDTNPELFGDDTGIPESGNGVPDILDEVRYELEWMRKMQSENGGVYHKVTCANFPGYVMPEYETDQLIVTPVSSTATADFCASMAMAYEFYLDVDAAFAQECLAAAERAWGYLEENPNLVYTNPTDITTGDYGDYSDWDERYWAAAQMYRATGEETYLTALEGMRISSGLDWTTVGDYGNIALLTMDDIDTTLSVYEAAENALLRQADGFVTSTSTSAYGVAISKFNWGSNMTVANAGVILGLAYQLTGEAQYLNATQSNLHYLLGHNPNGVCFVTGFGTVSPQNPHHRPSMAKGTAMPGMLVGGVNSNLEDSAAKAYLAGMPEAKCYVDHSESYSTNEITIYWNSPLTYLLSLSETTPEESPATLDGDINGDGNIDLADLVMLQQYLLGNVSLTQVQGADLCANGTIDGLDLAMLRQMLAAQ